MRNQQRRSGQSLVEFALLLPWLLLLVMGLFDIGRAVFYFAVLNTAVREGTRLAIVQPYSDYESSLYGDYPDDKIDLSNPVRSCEDMKCEAHKNICKEITDKKFNIGELSSVTITINHINHDVNSSDDPVINIKIEFSFNPITPGIALLIGELPINVESEMLLTPIAEQ